MAFKLKDSTTDNSSKKTDNSIESFLQMEISFGRNKFSNKKKQYFYQELSVLLKAGITLRDAITLIGESFKKKYDKGLTENVLNDLTNGHTFPDAIFRTKSFSDYEFHSLKIGEETGTMGQVCAELASFFIRKNEQRRLVVAALTYPAIVLMTAALVVIFMLTYVVPMFKDIFSQNSVQLPLLTRIIVALSALTKSYGIAVIFVISVTIVILNFFKNNFAYRKFLHYSILKVPVFGGFVKKIYIAQFTQAIALLTTSKVPMLDSIRLVRQMIKFVPLQEALDLVEKSILQGKSLSICLRSTKIFDSRIISLVKVAEETNQTEYVFRQLSEQYNHEVAQQSKTMTTLLEPIIIVVVGIIVAVLLIAMYLPMFQLGSVIG